MFCIGITEFLQSCFSPLLIPSKESLSCWSSPFLSIYCLIDGHLSSGGGLQEKGLFQKAWTRCFVGLFLGKCVKAKKKRRTGRERWGGYLFSLELVQLSLVLSDTFFVLKCCVYFPTPLLTTPTQSLSPPLSYTMMWPPTCPFQHGIGLLSLSNRITRFCDLEGAELSFFFVKIWQKSIKVSRNVGLSMQTIF